MTGVEPAAELPHDLSPPKAPKPTEPPSEDSLLPTLSLPASHLRRIAKAAAPLGSRFSSEAIAALQRVAQVYILYATDRAIAQAQSEAADAKKKKSKSAGPIPTGRKMGAEHVMRFLGAEMPTLATKLSNLLPDEMQKEFRPVAHQLLEEYRAQQRKLLAPPPAAASAMDVTGQAPPAAKAAGAKAAVKGGLGSWAKTSKPSSGPSGAGSGKKRGRPAKGGQQEEPAAKRHEGAAAGEPAPAAQDAPQEPQEIPGAEAGKEELVSATVADVVAAKAEDQEMAAKAEEQDIYPAPKEEQEAVSATVADANASA
eukprot:TRINITY_DN24197_c0_g1_i1.p1 TRINITY_DN24197_c0_g1~~TRINITY_DN24197_c0_g1_i1.p1  ORF type:complete len:312 (-),score=98.55 TRINITY_DN24197_c0_g1_i1:117-1052(-)